MARLTGIQGLWRCDLCLREECTDPETPEKKFPEIWKSFVKEMTALGWVAYAIYTNSKARDGSGVHKHLCPSCATACTPDVRDRLLVGAERSDKQVGLTERGPLELI